MELIAGLIIGLVLGGAGLVFVLRHRRAADAQLKDAFAGLSQQALQANSEQLLQLAKEVLSSQADGVRQELDGDKKLIDQNLEAMQKRLAELQQFVQRADRDREGSNKVLASQLKTAAQETVRLREKTDQLTAALANPQQRGQWGERMAEDVLRLAGFVEGVNYTRQEQVKSGTTRPDYTFQLPNGLTLNMDVKFPLANYLEFLDADADSDRQRFGKAFIADVRNRVKEAASRDYINPAERTVDYALVFIPNEQVYASIHQLDGAMVDYALQHKIVLCSPLTLYAVLAVIRQASENFAMERKAFEMANLINAFAKQWRAFKDEMDRLGKQLETVHRTYDGMVNTRTRQLEKPIDRIEELRTARETPQLEDQEDA